MMRRWVKHRVFERDVKQPPLDHFALMGGYLPGPEYEFDSLFSQLTSMRTKDLLNANAILLLASISRIVFCPSLAGVAQLSCDFKK